MTFSSTIKIQYKSKWEYTGSIYDDEMLPEENITFEVPADDLNTIQLFSLFNKFMLAIGHNPQGIDKGALSLVFNEMRSKEDMRKAAEEYELIMVEDFAEKEVELEKRAEKFETLYWKIKHSSDREIRDLKAIISRLENPENPQYTEEELEAMCDNVTNSKSISCDKEDFNEKTEI